MKQFFCLGTYNEPILFGTGEVFEGKGKGVSIYCFEDGYLEEVSSISVSNPSFLCIDEAKRKIYTVNEGKEYLGEFGGGITQITYGQDGSMRQEFTANTGATDPCHIAVDPQGKLIGVANFASGALTTYPLDEAGNIVNTRSIFQHQGQSVHPVRQKGPHAHAVVFAPDAPYLMVPDLGIDQVVCYRYEGATVSLEIEKSVSVPAGSGPRSGEFSSDGRHFYLINEISSQVSHYLWEQGVLTWVQCVPTLPEDFQGNNICSDLHLSPDGKHLYASNRGHDSIVVFQVDEAGNLHLKQRISCGGKTPRNFALDNTGKYVLVGNQDSDTICVFAIAEDGTLAPYQTFEVGTPVCIRFFEHTQF